MTVEWCFFGCLLGPILGVAGMLSRTGRCRLPFQLLVPLVAALETAMRLHDEAPMQTWSVVTTWNVTLAVAAATMLFLVSYAIYKSLHRRLARPDLR